MGLRRDDIRLPDPRTTIVGRERVVRHPAMGARRQDACEYDGGANRRCLLTAPRQARLLVRLFTAIGIPANWRDEAVQLHQRLASDFGGELRFVTVEQLHVTVRFLGEVADDRAADLSRTIEAIQPLTPLRTLEAAGPSVAQDAPTSGGSVSRSAPPRPRSPCARWIRRSLRRNLPRPRRRGDRI